MYICAKQLKPGAIVPIYTNWRESQNFEGFAELLEPVGDLVNESFSFNENLKDIKVYDKNNLKLSKSFKKLKKFNQLDELFNNTKDKHLITLKNIVKKNINQKELLNYNTIFKCISEFKNNNVDKNIISLDNLFKEHSIKYLTLYFQQTMYKEWDLSIFNYQRWKVRFYPQKVNGYRCYDNEFITHRNIKYIVANSPKPEHLKYITTYTIGFSKLNVNDQLVRNYKKLQSLKLKLEHDRK